MSSASGSVQGSAAAGAESGAPGAASEIEEPARVPGFVLHELLGEGGFAQVFAADREGESGGRVAIKISHVDAPSHHGRFQREASAMSLIGPPHTPALYASGRLDDGRPFIAMERLFGETLADRLERMTEPPSLERAAAMAEAILAAIGAAHGRGVVHRDLKPENVFFPIRSTLAFDAAGAGVDERAVLLDFGLTKAIAGLSDRDAPLTRTGVIVGTPEYMSPEQIRADPEVGAPADIYAFGVLLFELLTLRLPFMGDVEHGHLALRPPRPSEIWPAAEPLDDLTLACLSKDADRRPKDLSAMLEVLRALHRSARAAAAELSVDGPKSASPESSAPSARTGSGARAKMIADGRQPVVVLVAESRSAAAPIIASITSQGGFVVRQRGSRYVGVFSGMDVNDPAHAALAAARDLEARFAARAALHLDSVTLRRKERKAPTVYGACVDRPETWMPSDPWSGIVLTAALARVVPESELASPLPAPVTAPAFFSAASASAKTDASIELEIPLLGRDDVLAALRSSATSALSTGATGLFTLIGEHGLGKTRLAAEAKTAAAHANADAQIIALKASPNAAIGSAREASDLLRAALDAPPTKPPDVQAFCVDRLGDELGAEVAPSVAEALGWSDSGAAPLAPATFHHGVVRALAEALRRRARKRPVAVILDDAQWADDAVLDALEYATLDGSACPLWVAIAAHPRFEASRKTWGSRTQNHAKVTLGPLDEASAAALAARLLLPAEYPPAATLKRLADWSGGNPFSLREIIRDLKRSGIVRRRTYAGTYYVATAELDNLPPSPAWQWLAARQLEALPQELAAFVRLCSVLGVSFTRAELERVQDAIDRAGDAGTPVDVGYGLGALVDRKILKRDDGARCSFQNALFQDAVYEMLDPAQRERAHRRAFEAWRSQVSADTRDVDALERLARHAGACGERDAAADAHFRIGVLLASGHKHTEADEHFTAALGFTRDDRTELRASALMMRGKSRYRVHRPRDSKDDLSSAREIASLLGDDALLADALLEEATALDWTHAFEDSALRVEEAGALIERAGIAGLRDRLLVGRGRTRFRRGRMEEAVELLARGVAGAKEDGDYETRIVALLLLAPALVCAGRLDEAETRFEESIELSTRVEDWAHLGAAYQNRSMLWAAKGALHLAAEDMRRAIPLARQIGNPWIEQSATCNVAEILYWGDRIDEAITLIRRAHVLEQRFSESPAPHCSLLLARFLIAVDNYEEAARHVAWVERACPPDSSSQITYAFFRMLRLVLADVGASAPGPRAPVADWDEVITQAWDGAIPDEQLELLYWWARTASQGARSQEALGALARSGEILPRCPAWQRRFTELAGRIGGVQAGALST